MGFYKRCIAVLVPAVIILGCAPRPALYYKSMNDIVQIDRVAVLPFENVSGEPGAAEKVDNVFLVELLKSRMFQVVEPGQVKRALLRHRIRSTEKIDFETLKALGSELRANAFVLGSVLDFGSDGQGGQSIPVVGIVIRMLDARTGEIIWSSAHTRNGNDGEIVFGIGRITSLSRMANVVTRDLVGALVKAVQSPDPVLAKPAAIAKSAPKSAPASVLTKQSDPSMGELFKKQPILPGRMLGVPAGPGTAPDHDSVHLDKTREMAAGVIDSLLITFESAGDDAGPAGTDPGGVSPGVPAGNPDEIREPVPAADTLNSAPVPSEDAKDQPEAPLKGVPGFPDMGGSPQKPSSAEDGSPVLGGDN